MLAIGLQSARNPLAIRLYDVAAGHGAQGPIPWQRGICDLNSTLRTLGLGKPLFCPVLWRGGGGAVKGR